jgi:hypothetical protein
MVPFLIQVPHQLPSQSPYAESYMSWLSSLVAPTSFETFGRQPCYFTLREYYCCSPCVPVPFADDGSESWLKTCRWTENELNVRWRLYLGSPFFVSILTSKLPPLSVAYTQGGIVISDNLNTFTAHYQPLQHERISAVGPYVRSAYGPDADTSSFGAAHVVVAGRVCPFNPAQSTLQHRVLFAD